MEGPLQAQKPFAGSLLPSPDSQAERTTSCTPSRFCVPISSAVRMPSLPLCLFDGVIALPARLAPASAKPESKAG